MERPEVVDEGLLQKKTDSGVVQLGSCETVTQAH